jgi:hypothetical protein
MILSANRFPLRRIMRCRADTAPYSLPEYRSKSTDWLKAAFTVLLHAPFSKLRFILNEAAALMVKPWLRRA